MGAVMLWKGFLAFHLLFPFLVIVLLLLCLFDPNWWVVQADRTCSVGFFEIACCAGEVNCTSIARRSILANSEDNAALVETSILYLLICALIFVVLAVLVNLLTIWTNILPRVLVGFGLLSSLVCMLGCVLLYAYNSEAILAKSVSSYVPTNQANLAHTPTTMPGQTYFVGILCCFVLSFCSAIGILAERKNMCHAGKHYDEVEATAVMAMTQQQSP